MYFLEDERRIKVSLKCILQGQDSKNLATKVELNEHINNKDNPHEVTAI
nr:MAG TPA: hypothetical protein [Caudoviricetes sp.]